MPKPVSRLDAAMEERRLELNLEWREIAKRGGLTYETLRTLRRSGVVSALSKRRAESGLQWAQGSIDSVLAGGNPVALDAAVNDSHGPADADELDLVQRIAELEDELEHLNPRYERNRPSLVAHLQRQIDDAQKRLKDLRSR
jgi:hypothetical protein